MSTGSLKTDSKEEQECKCKKGRKTILANRKEEHWAMHNWCTKQACRTSSFWDGGVLDGGGIVLLVEAAGQDDGKREESQLDELPWSCRNYHRDWEVSEDLGHYPSILLIPRHVSLLAHLIYAFFLFLFFLLSESNKYLFTYMFGNYPKTVSASFSFSHIHHTKYLLIPFSILGHIIFSFLNKIKNSLPDR